jgi:hypothetical protein
MVRAEGSKYCSGHDAAALKRLEAKKVRQYLLTDAQFSGRLAALTEHDDITSLREEIAFARMLIEKRFNMITDEGELLAACGTLNTLLLTVERLVKSCNLVERNLGTLLSKPSVLSLGREIIEIIVAELEDVEDSDEIIDRIGDQIIAVILESGKNQGPE